MDSNLNLDISKLTSTLLSGSIGDDGSVQISKSDIDALVEKGLITQNEDGTYRLNVDESELEKAQAGSSSSSTKVVQNLVIRQQDSISAASTTTTVESPVTASMNKASAATLNAVNMQPQDPSPNASANPYLSTATSARTRVLLTALFGIQMQIAAKMQENQMAMTGMITSSAFAQARGIELAGEGERFGMLMSSLASTTAATSLLTGALMQHQAGIKEAGHRHKTAMLKEGFSDSTMGQIVDDDDDTGSVGSSGGSVYLDLDDSESDTDSIYGSAAGSIKLDHDNDETDVDGLSSTRLDLDGEFGGESDTDLGGVRSNAFAYSEDGEGALSEAVPYSIDRHADRVRQGSVKTNDLFGDDFFPSDDDDDEFDTEVNLSSKNSDTFVDKDGNVRSNRKGGEENGGVGNKTAASLLGDDFFEDMDDDSDEGTSQNSGTVRSAGTRFNVGGATEDDSDSDGVKGTRMGLGGATDDESDVDGMTGTRMGLGGATDDESDVDGMTGTRMGLGGVTEDESDETGSVSSFGFSYNEDGSGADNMAPPPGRDGLNRAGGIRSKAVSSSSLDDEAFLSIDLEENKEANAASGSGSKKDGLNLREDLKKANLKRAMEHELKADIYSNRGTLAMNLAKVHENMAMALKHNAQILASKMSTAGRIQEVLNSTAEKISERGAQASASDLRQALENANKLMQLISAQAQADTEVSGRIIRG